MKLYTFTVMDSDEILAVVRAKNHDEAVAKSGLNHDTDFYSQEIDLFDEDPVDFTNIANEIAIVYEQE